jgi:DNA polymerase elongation subunit (family B)
MKVPLSVQADEENVYVVSNRQVHTLSGKIQYQIEILGSPAWKTRPKKKTMINPFTGKREGVSLIYHTDLDEHLTLSRANFDTESHSLDPLEQIYVRYPDAYLKYPQTDDPVILYMDIEVGSDGGALFPKPDRSPILMLGYAIDNGDIQILSVDDPADDSGLCQQWVDLVSSVDPDIIVTYSGRRFDLPFLKHRCLKHGIDMSPMKRIAISPYQVERDKHRKSEERFDDTYLGRIEFDVYFDGTARDMSPTIMGLPNRKMKTVAHAYDIAVGQEMEDSEMRNMLAVFEEDRDKLDVYLESDVHITRELAGLYLPNLMALAEANNVPVDALMQTYKSFIPKLLHARAFHKKNYTAFHSNMARYNPTSGIVKRIGGGDNSDSGDMRYEGAYVGILRPGRHENVYHIDFGSMYPSMIRTLHLSPETVRVSDVRPYNSEYKFKRETSTLWLLLPDKGLNRQLLIRIDLTKKGFLETDVEQAMLARFVLKNQAKKLKEGSKKYKWTKAQDNALKILLNSIYGLEGEKTTEYGSYPIAIVITAMCRYLIREVVEKYKDIICEYDTDGIYITEEVDINEVNRFVREKVRDIAGEDGYMIMEQDGPYPVACFYKSKNYIMQHPDGTISKHGNSFKSATHCPGIRRFVEKIAELQISNAPREEYLEVLRTVGNPDTWIFSDFVCNYNFRRDASDFSSFSMHSTSLSEQLAFCEGEDAIEGDMVEYVHTKHNWAEFRSNAPSQRSTANLKTTIIPLYTNKLGIDMLKYTRMIEKTLNRFNIDPDTIHQPSPLDILG